MMDINADLPQWLTYFSIKKLLVEQLKIKLFLTKNQLNKPINRNFNKRKVHSLFIDNIWGTDLADM